MKKFNRWHLFFFLFCCVSSLFWNVTATIDTWTYVGVFMCGGIGQLMLRVADDD